MKNTRQTAGHNIRSLFWKVAAICLLALFLRPLATRRHHSDQTNTNSKDKNYYNIDGCNEHAKYTAVTILAGKIQGLSTTISRPIPAMFHRAREC